MKTLLVFTSLTLFSLILLQHALPVNASDVLGNWNSVQNLPMNLASHSSFVFNDKIYTVGGSALTGQFGDQVYKAAIISPLGTISNWINDSPLPERRIWQTVVQYNDYVYTLGGYLDQIQFVNNVYFSKLNPDGSLGAWIDTTPLPETSAQGAAVVVNGVIYYAGGIDRQTIYKSTIQADGSLGAWSTAGQLPTQLSGFTMLYYSNRLYIFGGGNGSGSSSAVYRTNIQGDGAIDIWTPLASVPRGLKRGGGVLLDNRVFIVGGLDGSQALDTTFTTTINSQGNLDPWSTSASRLPRGLCCFSLARWQNLLYLSGGHDGVSYFSDVYTASIDVNVTPTPTPTPIPTTKAVIVPGFGGSWNADALLNCKIENYSGEWSLAPYAVPVYLSTDLELQSKGITPYYYAYDWRKPVSDSATGLVDFISAITQPNEKIYLVGHSLGGLVTQAYLLSENNWGKVEKYLAVGAPFQGTPWAYGAWAGGELWNSNILYKLGSEIALRYCGIKENSRIGIQQQFPVIQTLLPTFNYLLTDKSKTFIPTNSLITQNNWLPQYLPSGHISQIGTLTGTGIKTIDRLVVKEQNKKDFTNGDWVDGKVTEKKTSSEGDQTVLVFSGQLPGANNITIQQQHLGLVMSTEGARTIANYFVSIPAFARQFTSNENEFQTPTSALVFLGKDIDINDSSGIMAFLDPKKGIYTVKIKSKGPHSTFSVLQVLPNQKTVWKDYSIPNKKNTNVKIEYSGENATVSFD